MTFDEPNKVSIARVRRGSYFVLGFGTGQTATYPNGTWAISKIHVSAAFYDYAQPAQMFALPESTRSLEIVGDNWQGQPWPGNPPATGLAAYTTVDGYVPTLTFTLENGDVYAEVKARWNWGTTSAPPLNDSSPVYDGKTRDKEKFNLVYTNPSPCPCPTNP